MLVQDYGIQNMLWSKNNINIFNSAIVGIAMFCGSCINGLYAQDKIKVDVYANLYLSGNTTIGNVLEELVVGYHMPDNSFIGACFMHSGVERAFYGGTLNYSYVKAWESSFQLVPSIETGFLYGPFSGNITQTKFIVGFGLELRQWFGRKKNSFCGIGSKVLCITAVDVSLWNGLTFGMSF